MRLIAITAAFMLIGVPLITVACGKAAADEPPKCGAVSFGTVGTGALCLMPNGDRCYLLGQSISCLR